MRLGRRELLIGLGAIVATPGTYVLNHWLRFVRAGDAEPILSAILDRHLPGIEISDEDKRRFAQDFLQQRMLDARQKMAWLGLLAQLCRHTNLSALPGTLGRQFRHLEDRVITHFILGSDLLQNGPRSKRARYTGINWVCIGQRVRLFAIPQGPDPERSSRPGSQVGPDGQASKRRSSSSVLT